MIIVSHNYISNTMPGAKKKKGGKRVRRGKKNAGQTITRSLTTKDKNQEYVRVTGLLGDCRLNVINIDGVERIAIIRGKMRKRVWIKKDDILLVGLRGYQDDRVDVLHKYNSNESKQLVKKGEIVRDLLGEIIDAGDGDGDDGVRWSMPANSSEEESGENGENGESGKSRKQIAPQPIVKDIDDISSDSDYDLEDL